MAEYKDVELLKKQIADFKRAVNSVKPMNSDYLTGYISALSVVEGAIAEKPAADVSPVCHGVWASEETAVTCTACGRSYDTDFEIKRNVIRDFDYCPNCGAKMDGDKNA